MDLRSEDKLPFWTVVNFFGYQTCQEACDRLYALLGLCSCHIRVDYRTDSLNLYINALAAYMLSLKYEWILNISSMPEFLNATGNQFDVPVLLKALHLDLANPAVLIVTKTILRYFAPEVRQGLELLLVRGYMLIQHTWAMWIAKDAPLRRRWRNLRCKLTKKWEPATWEEAVDAYRAGLNEAVEQMRGSDQPVVSPDYRSVADLERSASNICDEALAWHQSRGQVKLIKALERGGWLDQRTRRF